MQTNFDYETSLVLQHEGGYGWDRADPGGPTNYGITYIDYAEFKGKPVATPASWVTRVKAMPKSDALAIYRNKYWAKERMDDISSGADYSLYDYGITSGIGRSARVARALFKDMPPGTTYTPQLVTAINKADTEWFISSVNAERLHFLQNLRTWPVFGKGWGTRVAEVKQISLRLAKTPATDPVPPVTPNLPGKGKSVPDPKMGKKIGKVGAGGAAAGGVAGGYGHQLEIALAIGAAIIIAGVVIWIVHSHRAMKAQNTVVLPPGVVPRAP